MTASSFKNAYVFPLQTVTATVTEAVLPLVRLEQLDHGLGLSLLRLFWAPLSLPCSSIKPDKRITVASWPIKGHFLPPPFLHSLARSTRILWLAGFRLMSMRS
jgi:hypothetical protein